MRVMNNSLTGALYNRYQSGSMDSMSYTDFNRLVQSLTPNGSFTSPEGQLWSDYQDWKKEQPQRSLPDTKGLTDENIAYLKEHFSGELNIFQRVDAYDTMAEMGIITKQEMFEVIGFGPVELVSAGSEKIVANGTPEEARAKFMAKVATDWSGFFNGAAIMQSDSLEDLFKLLDEQLKNSKDKDAAQEIKDVLEQVARKSFGASWAMV